MPNGSRVIAYNSQVCDGLNWYLLGQRSDPGHHFAWLTEQLEQVESDGGIAILIGHIDPNDCQHQWGVRYRALMERYQNVVRFALQGHTHNEDFQVNLSMTHPDRAVSVNSVGPSLTPYTHKNPSFQVIEFDAETMLPLNMKTYSFNLNEANQTPDQPPKWALLHDWIDTYGMDDFSPKSFLRLSERFKTDQNLANMYSWNRGRQYGNEPTNADGVHLFCNTSCTEVYQYRECVANHGIEMEYEVEGVEQASAPGVSFHGLSGDTLADWIIGDWVNISD